MISINDTTILAMLSRYPDMSADEADGHISRIENEQNIPICHAVLGRISPDDLDEEAQQVFNQFQNWSTQKTNRIRNEQQLSRLRQTGNRLASRLTQLHEQGIISEQTLMLYGISGPLPEQNMYNAMSIEEKRTLWEERMVDRFGTNWRERFSSEVTEMPIFSHKEQSKKEIDWLHEGF